MNKEEEKNNIKNNTKSEHVALGNLDKEKLNQNEKPKHIDLCNLYSTDKNDKDRTVYDVKAIIPEDSTSVDFILLLDMDFYNKQVHFVSHIIIACLNDFKKYFLFKSNNKVQSDDFLKIHLTKYTNKYITDSITYDFKDVEKMMKDINSHKVKETPEEEKGEVDALNKVNDIERKNQSCFLFHFCQQFDEKNDCVTDKEIDSGTIRSLELVRYEMFFMSDEQVNSPFTTKLAELVNIDTNVLQ